jgi:membrane associated rhomboid family serine protease
MFVQVPSRRKPRPPLATYALVLVSLACFIALLMQDSSMQQQWVQRLGVVPQQIAALGSTAAPSWGLVLSSLLSALFVHASWVHLIGNLVFLLAFGVTAERLLGARRLMGLYLICGMLANAAGAALLAPSATPVIGASGAVSALVGAYAALFPRARLGLVLPLGAFVEFVRVPAYALIGLWVLVQMLMYVLGPDDATVAWPVHIAGFALGVTFAWTSRSAIARRLRN